MFCKFCGNEVNENAIVCPKCGCAITTISKENANYVFAFNILAYITVFLVCLSLFFFAISIVDIYINVSTTTVSTYYNYNHNHPVNVSYYFSDCTVVSLVFAVLAFLSNLGLFTLGLKPDNKSKNKRLW